MKNIRFTELLFVINSILTNSYKQNKTIFNIMCDVNRIQWGSDSHKRKLSINDDLNMQTKRKRHNNSNKKKNIDVNTNDNTNLKDDGSESDNQKSICTNSSDIYSYNNHIYFYSGIDKKSIITLQKELRTTVDKYREKMITAQNSGFIIECEPIFVHINSPGGVVFDVLSFIDFLTQLKIKHPDLKFNSVVEGATASAGTLMSVVFDKRIITENAYMLIHQLSSAAWGKYSEIKDEVKNLDKLMTRIKYIYKRHCTIPNDKLDKILNHDIYWTANKCLKYGLVDEIIKHPNPRNNMLP